MAKKRAGNMQPAADPLVSKMKRAVRKAERATATGAEIGGTGYTVIKLRQAPITELIEGKRIGKTVYRIGPDERMAADEISLAVGALTNRLWIRPQNMERVDGGRNDAPWPARIAGPVERYQRFADHWSKRAKAGDPTLSILWAAVIDERPIRAIAYDHSIHQLRALRAILGGLRDYAARAGFVTGHLASAWQEEAAKVFPVDHPDLAMAKMRARTNT